MADAMQFPESWKQFLHDYEFRDSSMEYTNGSMLVPSFRVEQMIEHYFRDAVPVVRCKDCIHRLGDEYPMCMLHTEPCANARGYKGEAVCVGMDGFCSYGKERAKPINSAPLNQEERWLKTV